MKKIYLGQTVRTPDGEGVVVRVFMDYSGVHIRSETAQVTVYFEKPVSIGDYHGKRITWNYKLDEVDPVEEKPVNELLVDVKTLYADVLAGFSGCDDEHKWDYSTQLAIEERLEKILSKYR